MEDGHLDPTLGAPVGSGGGGGKAGSGAAGVGGAARGGAAADSGGETAMLGGGAGGRAPEGPGGAAMAGLGGASENGGQPGGQPESLCDRYCASVMNGCTGEHAQYIDFAACQTSCAELPEGEADARVGNTVHCRLTYAQKAPSEPYTYCTWAGPGGDGKCGSNCEGFCTLMMRTCDADSTDRPGEYFGSVDECQSTCEGLEDVGMYSATDPALQTGQDHVQCRLYHVGAAIAEDDPITHCSHAMGLSLCSDKGK